MVSGNRRFADLRAGEPVRPRLRSRLNLIYGTIHLAIRLPQCRPETGENAALTGTPHEGSQTNYVL